MNAVLKNMGYAFALFALLFLSFLTFGIASGYYLLAIIPFGALLFYAAWKHLAVAFIVLLVSLPLSIEYQVTSTLATDAPDELLMVAVSALFLFRIVYRPSAIPQRTWVHPLMLLIYLSLAWALIATLLSVEPLLSAKFLLAKGWYLCAFVGAALLLFANRKTMLLCFGVLAVSMLAVTIFTIVRHAGYAFSFAGINDALRPFFRNHVNYSAMLVCMVPVWWAWYRLSSGNKWMIAAALLITLAALFFSYARGAWAALFMGMIAWELIRRKWLVRAYIIAIIFVVAAAAWLIRSDNYLKYAHHYQTTIFHEDFGEHLVATYKLKDLSTAERFYRWVAGVRMVADHPLTGFGPNTFYKEYKPYAVPAFRTWVSDNPEHSTVHNYFLMLAVEQGIPGLLIFILLNGLLLWYAQRLYHQAGDMRDRLIALAVGSVLVMILTVNFLSDLIETDKVGSLFFLCIATLVSCNIYMPKGVEGRMAPKS